MVPEIPGVLPDITPDIARIFTLPLRFSIPPHILVLVFAVVVAFWAVMTVIFLYHWRKFPYDKPFLKAGEMIYLSGSAVFILIALGGIVAS